MEVKIDKWKFPCKARLGYEVFDWDIAEYPIWVKNENEDIIIITSIDYNVFYNDNVVKVITIPQLIHDENKIYYSNKELMKWLNSLKILPKGTKIEITL